MLPGISCVAGGALRKLLTEIVSVYTAWVPQELGENGMASVAPGPPPSITVSGDSFNSSGNVSIPLLNTTVGATYTVGYSIDINVDNEGAVSLINANVIAGGTVDGLGEKTVRFTVTAASPVLRFGTAAQGLKVSNIRRTA